jgi:hypothetical protein
MPPSMKNLTHASPYQLQMLTNLFWADIWLNTWRVR